MLNIVALASNAMVRERQISFGCCGDQFPTSHQLLKLVLISSDMCRRGSNVAAQTLTLYGREC